MNQNLNAGLRTEECRTNRELSFVQPPGPVIAQDRKQVSVPDQRYEGGQGPILKQRERAEREASCAAALPRSTFAA